MLELLLTQNSTFIIGPVAKLLGFVMQGIFWLLDKVGIQNIGLAIILFTLVIYLCLMPLTIRQQKFSKMSAIMNPELTAIQDKYKGKKDQDSMMKMQEETKAVYAKYGVSPSGSCLQLLIQMPILFALYRVIYSIPAYVPQVKEVYTELVDKIVANTPIVDYIRDNLSSAKMFAKQFTNTEKYDLNNTIIDVLNRATPSDWNALKTKYRGLSKSIDSTTAQLNHYNNFLGLNIAFSPVDLIKMQFTGDNRNWWIIIGAVLIPILAAATQWINLKLTPQASQNNNSQENSMASSMKMMNNMMPIMSAFFCLTLPAGMGLYWIAGSVIRSVQQVVINKQIDKINLDEMIAKNNKKYEEKLKKKGVLNDSISKRINSATTSTGRTVKEVTQKNNEERKQEIAKAQEYLKKTEKKGSSSSSFADKVNMVKEFNERNNKK